MCCLCLVSERSFLRDPQPFLKKEKKSQKKSQKISKWHFWTFFDCNGFHTANIYDQITMELQPFIVVVR